DALWAGVPLVTRVGETFAGRVAASLLSAHGFPDLITRSEDQYLALVLDLATNDKKRLSIRAALEAARKTSPLFDTMRFTKDLEAMYREIIADWRRPSDQRPPVVSLT